jgi:Ca2+-binding EF-hand superfamily protein
LTQVTKDLNSGVTDKIDEAFKEMDGNDDGALTHEEALEMFKNSMGVTTDMELDNPVFSYWFEEMDKNHDMHITKDEMANFMEKEMMPYFPDPEVKSLTKEDVEVVEEEEPLEGYPEEGKVSEEILLSETESDALEEG